MVTTALQTDSIVDELADGWTENHFGRAQQFVVKLKAALGQRNTETDDHTVALNTFRFEIDVSKLCMSGLGERVHCLLVAGIYEDVLESVNALLKRAGTSIPFVFCATKELQQELNKRLPMESAALVSPRRMKRLLVTKEPIDELKDCVLSEFGKRRLNPYTIGRPAQGSMFFGRDAELSTLLENRNASFAIAGPSLIGKSSLLIRYRAELVRRRDPRAQRTYLIDMYECANSLPDTVAQHIAFSIVPRKKSWSIDPFKLGKYLKHIAAELGGPITLLLDEVDEICNGSVIEHLANAARSEYLRLILCGRRNLLEAVLGTDSPLNRRFELLRPNPLSMSAAASIIRQPMLDLGFHFADEDVLIDQILRKTGRLPYLLQFYGKRLIEMASREGTTEISLSLLHCLEDDFDTAQYILSPIRQLHDIETQRLAVAILKKNLHRCNAADISRLAGSIGQDQSTRRIMSVCNELVIANVLAYEHGYLQIANGALCHVAQATGYIDALEEELA